MTLLPLNFYLQEDVVSIGQELLGKCLFTKIGSDPITGGMIIETESYAGPIDRASHAYNMRRTKRNEVMYKKGGVAYVYLCYGIHHLFNVVTNVEGVPHAVLIRALKPISGVETMLKRRKIQEMQKLTSGPGALCQALGIDLRHNGSSLLSDMIWIEEADEKISKDKILAGPRIGIDYAGEDAFLPWRFLIKEDVAKLRCGSKSSNLSSPSTFCNSL
ncbi:MAG: DNA-3-methyladenine glycosylase [Anaerolineae bacterium]